MIERFPNGTDEIPFPHKVVTWKSDGAVDLWVELPPSPRGVYPKIAGWEPCFVGFFGYDRPQHVTYRIVKPLLDKT